jgi:hypothetical protein
VSFEFPESNSLSTTPEHIAHYNAFLHELINYLNNEEVNLEASQPIAPREGQIALASAERWDFAAGPGLYYYEKSCWVKVGNGVSRFPAYLVRGTLAGTDPLLLVVGTHVTVDPVTCWGITGSTPRHIELPTTGQVAGMIIAFFNYSLHEAEITYGSGIYMLPTNAACCFEYDGTLGWILK